MNKALNFLTIISLPISIISGVYTIFSDFELIFSVILFLIALTLIGILLFKNKGNFSFEVLEQDVILDIIDNRGELVKYKSAKKLRCIRKHEDEYIYSFSTSGYIDSIEVDNGFVKEIKKEDGRIQIITTFGKPINKNEEIKQTLTCNFNNSFTGENELWTLKRNDLGNGSCNLTILFPSERLYKAFRAYKTNGHSKKVSKIQPKEQTIQSKSALNFYLRKFKLHDEYKVKWTW